MDKVIGCSVCTGGWRHGKKDERGSTGDDMSDGHRKNREPDCPAVRAADRRTPNVQPVYYPQRKSETDP